MVANRALDDNGIEQIPQREFPENDRYDIQIPPLDLACTVLAKVDDERVIPTLIDVLERKPDAYGAAYALGEIGDPRGIPILMKVLKNNPRDEDVVVTALGQLKNKKAVPYLVSMIEDYNARPDRPNRVQLDLVFEALLSIGDESAIAPIEKATKGEFPKNVQKAARRILAQLRSKDPVNDLLALLDNEKDRFERSDLIKALTRYIDDRSVERLTKIAKSSDSAFMRREAINGLREIGTRKSLLALASLLDVPFPADLKPEGMGAKNGIYKFEKYFPETIEYLLGKSTKCDFGRDRSKWESWIQDNVKN